MSILITGGVLYTPQTVYDPGAILLEGTVIRAVGPAGSFAVPEGTRTMETPGQRIIPGLIDVHLHGFGGHHVMGPGLAEVIRALPSQGTTTFLPSSVSFPLPDVLRGLEEMAEVLAHPPVGALAPGIHMEGPWISPKRSGGMRPEYCYPLRRADLEACLSAARGTVRMITLAPEEGEVLDVLPWLVERGIIPSIGHSDATYDQVTHAVALGLNHATHAFNAMRPFLHRDPGVVGGMLDHEAITAELIADGFHVHPPAMRTLVRAKGLDRVCLISDAMFVAGTPEGVYDWDNRKIVHKGETSRFPDGAPAGSAMMLNRLLQVSVEQAGFSFADAVQMASEVPARVLGLRKGRLLPGYDADVVVLQENYRPSCTIIGGEIIFQE